jgi:hypothetical protein
VKVTLRFRPDMSRHDLELLVLALAEEAGFPALDVEKDGVQTVEWPWFPVEAGREAWTRSVKTVPRETLFAAGLALGRMVGKVQRRG